MNERRDDTTPAGPESPRAPGSYYYDDATGYEVYDPEADEEAGGGPEGEEEAASRGAPGGRRASRDAFSARASRP